MPGFELAQMNVAIMTAPLESPVMADFVDNPDRINALADRSPGFVWRWQTGEGGATAVRPPGESTIVNRSVWRDRDAPSGYVYRSGRVEIMRRRREGFERPREAHVVLWWLPARQRPTIEEGIERLEILRRDGPTRAAFTVRRAFPPTPPTASNRPRHGGSARLPGGRP